MFIKVPLPNGRMHGQPPPPCRQPRNVTSMHAGKYSSTSFNVIAGVFRSRHAPLESNGLFAGHTWQSRSTICWKQLFMAARPSWVLLKEPRSKLRIGSFLSASGAFCPIPLCFSFLFLVFKTFFLRVFSATLRAKGPYFLFCPLCIVVSTVQVSISLIFSKAIADATESLILKSPAWSKGSEPQ